MKTLAPLLTACLMLSPLDSQARGGGGGFRGGGGGEFREGGGEGGQGGIRDEDGGWDQEEASDDRGDGGDGRFEDQDANVDYREEGNGDYNVNVQAEGGRDYDANIAGPYGYRAGYVWRDGVYDAVDCAPWVPYAAPLGAWVGWSVVTQPDYLQYPVYATYPIETAVQVALMNLGLYSGPVDGDASACSGAIERYQEQNNLPVTGTITPDLLKSLGIQATGE